MLSINLLPWREQLMVRQKKNFIVTITCSGLFAMFILAVQYGAILYKENKIDDHLQSLNERKAMLTRAPQQEKVQSNQLSEHALLQVQMERKIWWQLLQVHDAASCFKEFSADQNAIILSGYTRAITPLFSYLAHLKAQKLLRHFHIDELHSLAKNFWFFKLSAEKF